MLVIALSDADTECALFDKVGHSSQPTLHLRVASLICTCKASRARANAVWQSMAFRSAEPSCALQLPQTGICKAQQMADVFRF